VSERLGHSWHRSRATALSWAGGFAKPQSSRYGITVTHSSAKRRLYASDPYSVALPLGDFWRVLVGVEAARDLQLPVAATRERAVLRSRQRATMHVRAFRGSGTDRRASTGLAPVPPRTTFGRRRADWTGRANTPRIGPGCRSGAPRSRRARAFRGNLSASWDRAGSRHRRTGIPLHAAVSRACDVEPLLIEPASGPSRSATASCPRSRAKTKRRPPAGLMYE
jgi:hypothetical protein